MTNAAHRFDNDLRYRDGDHPQQTQLTPSYVLHPVIIDLGGIDLDPCTTPANPCAAHRWYTVDDDGLKQPWDADRIFVNPPYGKAREPWVERCIQAAHGGSRVVLLMPAHTDTRTFQRALATSTAVVFIAGRVKFGTLRPNRRQEAASHPSALIGWNVNLDACAHLGLLVRPVPVGLFAAFDRVLVSDVSTADRGLIERFANAIANESRADVSSPKDATPKNESTKETT